jgi:hypothetical protein
MAPALIGSPEHAQGNGLNAVAEGELAEPVVFVVDDDISLRDGLKSLFRSAPFRHKGCDRWRLRHISQVPDKPASYRAAGSNLGALRCA